MKYRHQYHAGNFADVHKHVLLLEVLRALMRKDKGLLFVDTHAGRGEYDLHPGDTEHPAEWQAGAAQTAGRRAAPRGAGALSRRWSRAACTAAASCIRAPRCSRSRALRAVDRAVFFETQREEAGHLRKVLPRRRARRVEVGDGFAGTARAAAAAGAARLRAHRSALRRARGLRARARGRGGRAAAFRKRACCCCGCR